MHWLGSGLLVAGAALLAWILLAGGGSDGKGGVPDGAPGSGGDAGEEADAPIRWERRIEVATGEGHQGPWRMNESDFRYVDAPTVAFEEDGAVLLVWVDQARKDLFLQRYGPGGDPLLAEPVNVSRTPEVFSWLPRVAPGPPGSDEVYVLWQEIVFSGGSHGGEILFARSADGGRSFSLPINLSNTPAGAGKGRLDPRLWHNGSLDLAVGPDGTVYAAWTEYEGPLRVSRSTDGGETFSDPLLVAGGEGELPARGPSLAVGPEGRVHLAWTVGEDPAADIRLSASTDGGRSFEEARIPLPGPGHADAPKVAAGPDGTVHLVFGESPEGPLSRYRIRYARARSGPGEFEAVRTLEGPDPDGGRGGNFPALALDGEGNPHVLWELFPNPGRRPEGLAITVSPDGGDTFPPAAVVPGTGDPELGFNGSLQGLLMDKLAVGPRGRAAVVNGTFRPGEESRIRLFLGRSAAVPQGLLLPAPPGLPVRSELVRSPGLRRRGPPPARPGAGPRPGGRGPGGGRSPRTPGGAPRRPGIGPGGGSR